MNIYLVEATKFDDMCEWSHYVSFIVVAESEQAAKMYHPIDKHRWSGVDKDEPWESKEWSDWRNNISWNELKKPTDYEKVNNWVNNLDDLNVTLLGNAVDGITAGVISSSYWSYE